MAIGSKGFTVFRLRWRDEGTRLCLNREHLHRYWPCEISNSPPEACASNLGEIIYDNTTLSSLQSSNSPESDNKWCLDKSLSHSVKRNWNASNNIIWVCIKISGALKPNGFPTKMIIFEVIRDLLILRSTLIFRFSAPSLSLGNLTFSNDIFDKIFHQTDNTAGKEKG